MIVVEEMKAMRNSVLVCLCLLMAAPRGAQQQPEFKFDPSGAGLWTGPATPFLFRAPVTFSGPVTMSGGIGAADAFLVRDAANTLAMRNGGTTGTPIPQTFSIYNFCDGTACATGYERGSLYWSSNTFTIGMAKGGTGSNRSLEILSLGQLLFKTAGDYRWFLESTGHLYPFTNDTYDIGYKTLQVREFLLSRSMQGSKSKALTDATATAFVRVAIPQTAGSNYAAGEVKFTIFCKDAANQAVQQGNVEFACHNLAGTETCTFETVEEVAHGDGTAALSAPSFDIAAGTDTVDLRVTSDCTGVTPTTHTIQYRLDMMQPNTVTPQ
jgi:hypothetical protein